METNQIDAMAEARKHRIFKVYSAINWIRIRLAVLLYKLADKINP